MACISANWFIADGLLIAALRDGGTAVGVPSPLGRRRRRNVATNADMRSQV